MCTASSPRHMGAAHQTLPESPARGRGFWRTLYSAGAPPLTYSSTSPRLGNGQGGGPAVLGRRARCLPVPAHEETADQGLGCADAGFKAPPRPARRGESWDSP